MMLILFAFVIIYLPEIYVMRVKAERGVSVEPITCVSSYTLMHVIDGPSSILLS